MPKPPIDELNYLSGVTVVDIGDIRVSRGMTRRPASSCRHARLSYDPRERRIWCRDCEEDVEAFDAFEMIARQCSAALDDIARRKARLDELEAFQARSLAVKELDKAWRKKDMIPACPSCHQGLFPEDFKNGAFPMLGRDYADARRKKRS